MCVRGGGYFDIFIHTLALAFFLGFKILNFNIFFFFLGGGGGGVQKTEYLLGYEDFVDIFLFFGDHHRI